MSPEEQLDALIAGMNAEDATLTLLKWLFVRAAETQATVDSLIPVVGAMAGRLGIRRDELLVLLAKAR